MPFVEQRDISNLLCLGDYLLFVVVLRTERSVQRIRLLSEHVCVILKLDPRNTVVVQNDRALGGCIGILNALDVLCILFHK